MVAVLEHGDGYLVLPRFFVPAEGIRRRSERDGVPYASWADQGFIVATPGTVVDYGAVEAYTAELAERFRVEAIAIDRWNSTGTQTRLQEIGLPVVAFGQGFASMSSACKEVERLILNRQLDPRRQSGHALVPEQRGDRAGPGRQHQDRPAEGQGEGGRRGCSSHGDRRGELPRRPGRYTRSGRASWSSDVPQDHRRDGEGSQQMDQVRLSSRYRYPKVTEVAAVLALAPPVAALAATRRRSATASGSC